MRKFMFKKSITSILIIAFSLISSQPIEPDRLFNPNNSVIAWDYNGVLVQKDWSAITNHALSMVKKDWKIIGLLFWPPFWKELYKTYHSCSPVDDLLKQITLNFPLLEAHEDDLFTLINLDKSIEKTIEILKQMKKRGYRNYLASNIDEKSYVIAKEKYPAIFEQFIGSYFPQKNNLANDNAIAKPCLDYYLELRNYFATQGIDKNTTIIFIDDRSTNIQGAINSNHKDLNPIYGIHFQSPDQLKNVLAKVTQ